MALGVFKIRQDTPFFEKKSGSIDSIPQKSPIVISPTRSGLLYEHR